MLRAALRRVGVRVRELSVLTAGQDLIEYALLIALIGASVLVGMSGLGVKVPGFYETTAAALPGQGPASESPDDDPGGNPGKGNPGNGNPGNDKPVGNPGENPGKGKPAGGNGK